MSQFSVKSKLNNTYTLISDEFIDRYLPDANDAQIKVYLFLLRHLKSNKATGISVMADLFNYTEKDILRALKFWEKRQLLSLEYDEHNQLSFVHLTQPEPSLIENTPSTSIASKPSAKEFVKPDYTADQIDLFYQKDTSSEVLFIAESYLGKTLSASDLRSLYFILDELCFSVDMVDHLLQYCIDRGKRDFRYIEKVAVNWAKEEITTPKQAEQFSSRYNKEIYTVMAALGKNHTPTPKEAEYIKRWYQIYGFTSDIVLEACERTVMATDRHRFEYADKILFSWQKAGVHHKPDIEKIDATYKQTKKLPSPNSSNKFNQFQQNDYDFDQLERELAVN